MRKAKWMKTLLLAVLSGSLLFCGTDAISAAGGEQSDAAETTAAETKPAIPDGVYKKGKKTYYYKNGKKVKNKWITVKKKGKKRKYYFNKKGVMVTTKIRLKKKMYYFKSNGQLDHVIDTKKKMIALTYDDGPSAYTPIVVEALQDAGARATFFVVGDRVSTYKKQLKQAYKAGNEIANHSWDHSNLNSLSDSSVKNQVSKTNKAVKKVIGVKPVLIRPPYGSADSGTKSAIGMPAIMWNEDTEDWKTRSTSATIAYVKKHASDGDIILMHDLHKPTALAAESIVKWLKKKGYQMVTVSELAECRGIKLKKGKAYYSLKK